MKPRALPLLLVLLGLGLGATLLRDALPLGGAQGTVQTPVEPPVSSLGVEAGARLR